MGSAPASVRRRDGWRRSLTAARRQLSRVQLTADHERGEVSTRVAFVGAFRPSELRWLFLAAALAVSTALGVPTAWGDAPIPPGLHCSPGNPLVWVNTRSGVYHFEGQAWFGRTQQCEYMCQHDADAHGFRATYGLQRRADRQGIRRAHRPRSRAVRGSLAARGRSHQRGGGGRLGVQDDGGQPPQVRRYAAWLCAAPICSTSAGAAFL
jgi:hypothetical protein